MNIYLIATYLFWINVIAFWAYAMDKRYAHYNQWRIPEAVLIALSVVGGAYGAQMAMTLFRHKTCHKLFVITVPICLILWFALVIWLYRSEANYL